MYDENNSNDGNLEIAIFLMSCTTCTFFFFSLISTIQRHELLLAASNISLLLINTRHFKLRFVK